MASDVNLQDLMSFDTKVKEYIKLNEGYRSDIYKDTKKIPTTGYGFNLKAEHVRQHVPKDVLNGRRALTEQESTQILNKLYTQSVKDARQYLGSDVFDRLPTEKKQVVIDMAYNMGLPRLQGFKRMKESLIVGDYEKARRELLNSDYAVDVGDRAMRNANLFSMRNQNPVASLVSQEATMSDFAKAFASARKAGKKEFIYNGKKIKVEMK